MRGDSLKRLGWLREAAGELARAAAPTRSERERLLVARTAERASGAARLA